MRICLYWMLKLVKDVSMDSILQPNATELMYFLLDNYSLDVNIIVDMTLGNGNDAFKLLTKYPDAFLFGFDIQENAINNSKKYLSKEHSKARYKLILDDHMNVGKYLNSKVDLVIYNLGYLPGGDKSIKTSSISTITSLNTILKEFLNKNGLVFITAYTGHAGGEKEYSDLIEFINGLDQKQFNAMNFNFINQKNHPPKLIAIERLN